MKNKYLFQKNNSGKGLSTNGLRFFIGLVLSLIIVSVSFAQQNNARYIGYIDIITCDGKGFIVKPFINICIPKCFCCWTPCTCDGQDDPSDDFIFKIKTTDVIYTYPLLAKDSKGNALNLIRIKDPDNKLSQDIRSYKW